MKFLKFSIHFTFFFKTNDNNNEIICLNLNICCYLIVSNIT